MSGLLCLLMLASDEPVSMPATQPSSMPLEVVQEKLKSGFPIALGYGLRLGGQYRVMGNFNNFDFHVETPQNNPPNVTFNQRFRTWLNLHDIENATHGAYFQVEIGHLVFGNQGEAPKTYFANGSQTGIELRRGYLWAKPRPWLYVRAGLLGWHDRFGERPNFDTGDLFAVDAYDTFGAPLANSIWDFNVGGVSAEGKIGSQTPFYYRLGGFTLHSGPRGPFDRGTGLIAADGDVQIGSALIGASVYSVLDWGGYSYGTFGGPQAPYDRSADVWAGVRAHFKLGVFNPQAFVIYNHGNTYAPNTRHDAFAFKLGTDAATTAGTFHAYFHASTPGFRTIGQSLNDNRGAQTYWSLLGLSSPRGPSDIADLGLGLQNKERGLLSLQIAWEKEIVRTLALYLAAGALAPARSIGSGNIGGEGLMEWSWAFYTAMSLRVGAGVLAHHRLFENDAPSGVLYEVYTRYQMEL